MTTTTAKKTAFRTILIATAIVIALAAATLLFLTAPANTFTLDVNPSFEITSNRLDRVTGIAPLNDDARALLEAYPVQEDDLDDVIEALVDRLILAGYLQTEGENGVLITVKDGSASAEMVEQANEKIMAYLEQRQIGASILSQRIDADAQNGDNTSAGKLALIEKLLKDDDLVTAGELSNYSINELIEIAKAHNINIAELVDEYYDTLEDFAGGRSDYQATDYHPTDYNAPSASPTKTAAGQPDEADYCGSTDYYGHTDYDGITDYNNRTDYYSSTDYDGVTDYDKPGASKPQPAPSASAQNTDYGKTDYDSGKSNYNQTNYSNYGGNSGYGNS